MLKRLIALLLMLVMLSSAFLGCNDGGNGASDTSSVTTGSVTPPPSDKSIVTWFSKPYTKVMSKDIPKESVQTASVNIAKNEVEGIQVSISTSKRQSGMTFVVNETYDDIDVEMFRVDTVMADGVEYPDPIVPYEGTNFVIQKGKLRNMLINFKTNKDTKPGEYKYTFSLLDNKDNAVCSYTVNLKVFDITYPEEITLDTAFGLEFRSIAYSHGLISEMPKTELKEEEITEEIREMYAQYYEYMLENKITPMQLPYSILDDRADKYLDDPRVTSVSVPATVDDETLKKIYKKLCTKEEWINKAYIYPLDEPQKPEHVDIIIAANQKYEQICPRLRVATSFFVADNKYNETKDQLQALSEVLDIMTVKISLWDKKNLGWGFGVKDHPVYGTFEDRMNKYQEAGNTVWSYVCWEPQEPYLNLLLTDEGLDHRLLVWQQYTFGTTGFLYWCVNCYGHVKDPWQSVEFWLTSNETNKKVFGDGILIYPGSRLMMDCPIGSLRFEACRDGVEDYELIILAEKHLGKKWISDKIAEIITDVTKYTTDEDVFEKVRLEVMTEVEKALKK